jgi:hypothetical protein
LHLPSHSEATICRSRGVNTAVSCSMVMVVSLG